MSDFRTTFWDRELLPVKVYPAKEVEYPAIPAASWPLRDGRMYHREARPAFTRIQPPTTRWPAAALETKRKTRFSGKHTFRWTWMGTRCLVVVTHKRLFYRPPPGDASNSWRKWLETHKTYLEPERVDVYLGRNGTGPLVMTRRRILRLGQ